LAAVTDSVGTDSRDFSTIASQEASLGDHAGDTVTAEMYNDSVFDEDVLINDTTPDEVIYTVASGEEHDGTAGTGARIVKSADTTTVYESSTSIPSSLILLEIDGNGNAITNLFLVDFNANVLNLLRRTILHGGRRSGSANPPCKAASFNRQIATALNNIVYDQLFSGSGVGDAIGIEFTTSVNTGSVISNNTIDNIRSTSSSSSSDGQGLLGANLEVMTMQNNIVTRSTATTGNGTDYIPSAPTNATMDHNASSDTTSSGTGSLENVTIGNMVVSTVGGSEDYHQVMGAVSIDAGVDLATSPAGVEVDIDGRDRDAQGDTWDMGADEFVPAAVAETSSNLVTMISEGILEI